MTNTDTMNNLFILEFVHLHGLNLVVTQGVNPWIEVDGGVTPKNAYKVNHIPFRFTLQRTKFLITRNLLLCKNPFTSLFSMLTLQ